MAIPKIIGAQRDFSAGELDPWLKRADDRPERKAGARQMSNFRILNGGPIKNRPGRSLQQALTGITNARTEEFTMIGSTFKIVFRSGALQVFSLVGASLFTQAGLPWATNNLNLIDWAVLQGSMYIVFPGMTPQVLTWDGVSTWSIANYAFTVTAGGQVREPFYRLSPLNITLQPGGTTGSVSLTFSANVLTAQSVGTRIRFCGREILITAQSSGTAGTGTVLEALPPGQTITVTSDPRNIMAIGDKVTGGTSGAAGIVTALDATHVTVQLLQSIISSSTQQIVSTATNPITQFLQRLGIGSTTTTVNTITTFGFSASENISGPGGTVATSAVATAVPQAVAVWDDEVLNSARGFPQSVFTDQGRLGFANIPALPRAIVWSAFGLPNDFYVDGTAGGAMLELAPPEVGTVQYVVPGPESSEFVFGSNRIYYIPINVGNPLRAGSVAFQVISSDGSAPNVRPRPVQEVIVYIGAGSKSIMSIVAPGAYYRPYETRNLSELHSHLLNSPVAIAIPTATGTFEERYFYVLNTDGSIVVGKYAPTAGQIAGVVGLLPWTGAGTVQWVAALNADVIFTTNYSGAVGVMIEALDDTQYLDAAVSVNNLPSALAPGGGQGPLWFWASSTVTLMDQVTRMMGTYNIDANGNIIPQNNAGENLTIGSLVAGQPWTATLEPFTPDADPGKSAHQRMFKRRVSRMAAYVSQSTGFQMARLFSGPLTRTSPALGTVMNFRRVEAWNQDDDPTKPPPLREEAQRSRPIGRSFDARVAVIKDTPGPLIIHELGLEASI